MTPPPKENTTHTHNPNKTNTINKMHKNVNTTQNKTQFDPKTKHKPQQNA